jgi:hypothetical protein
MLYASRTSCHAAELSCRHGWVWFPASIALMLSIGGANNQLTGTRSQDHDRPSLLPVRFADATVAHSAFFGEAMEPYQWFWWGVMAGFIPCFVVHVVIVARAYGCIGIRRRGPGHQNHP